MTRAIGVPFTVLLLLFSNFLFCASPIFHIYIAEKWIDLQEDYSESEKMDFLVGTVFPDIQYLGVITREETHEHRITVKEIRATEDPFLKGMKLHSFVDEVRNHLLSTKFAIFDFLKDIPENYQDSFIKTLEDEVLYSKIDLRHFCRCLETFTPNSNITQKVSVHSINKWHSLLINYCGLGPKKLLAQLSLSNLGFFNIPSEDIQHWSIQIPFMSNQSSTKRYVDEITMEFEKIFKVDKESLNLQMLSN